LIFDPPPRSRRRLFGRFFWPLLIVAAVVIAVTVSAAGEETRLEIEYLDEMKGQAGELVKGAATLADVMSRLATIGRTEFVTVVEDLEEGLAAAVEFADADAPTATLIPVRAMYLQAVRAWSDGVAGLSTATLAAADDPDDDSVVDQMAAALAELRAGDVLYAEMVAAMTREDVPEPLTPMPRIVMSPSTGALVTRSVSYMASARSSLNTLGLRPGLAVSQIVSEPAWEVTDDDQVVVPATEQLVFSVVVTNIGNVGSETEQISLTMIGGPEEMVFDQEVPALDPNQQVTLIFDPVTVTPGTIYEVAAELVLTGGDNNLDDNEIRVQFTIDDV
jgi:hypothetical protein